ncbi:hypothetical protein ACFO6R_16110 [Eubacterium multiforme]|uniref:Uncharacterized protein n=1 Tax=Eubacterium multiforme TaxID=83339 RepID=A0ABT9UTH9_9FIRM|nr:hypothetical protein [Eubacterium multiforme]MDQ0149612.1 hypothetical protein [Eubacterium multiforme]
MRAIYSVSFKKSEKKLLEYAIIRSYKYNGFSEYIKILILKDREKMEHIFTDDELEEIEIIVRKILKEIK